MRSIITMLAVLTVIVPNAIAQQFPAKSIRVIVPFAPGGATDILARVISQKLGDIWGQQVVVDNRGGADGNIGSELAARSAPDGYTAPLPVAHYRSDHAMSQNFQDFSPKEQGY